MALGNTLNILRPPDRSTPPIQTKWNEALIKNLHEVLRQISQQVSSTVYDSTAVTITGGTITGITDLAIADGGTGSSTAASARTALGLGSMATQAASAVAITGGTVVGITDLTVADGGTGASTAGVARTNLGLAIGSDVQAQDAELAAIAGLTSATDKLPYFTGAGTASVTTLTSFIRGLLDDATAAAARTTLGLVIGTDIQTQNAALEALATLTPAADKLPFFTGATTASLTTITDFAVSILDDVNAGAVRATIGIGTIGTQAANSVSITGGTITGITDLALADGGTGASTASAARGNLGLGTMAVETAVDYAKLANPTFTGDPKAPTAATGDNDTSLATTAFVKAQSYETVANVALKANIASPSLTGNPLSITKGSGDNDTSIATTAFVHSVMRDRLINNTADVAATTISSIVNIVRTGSFATLADGGQGIYRRVGSEPSHIFKINSNSGSVWWELLPDSSGFVNVIQAGVVHDNRSGSIPADNTIALQAAIDGAVALGAKLDLGHGSIFVDGRITMDEPIHIVGRGNVHWPVASAARRSTTVDDVLPSASQIVFTGTGTRDLTIYGISSTRNCGADRVNLSTQGANYNDEIYRLLSFMDESTTTTRTQKSVSVAWHVTSGAVGSTFRNFRIVLDGGGSDGLDAYFGTIAASVAWSAGNSNWDIGIYNDICRSMILDDIQVVGPWQMAGYLITGGPSDGDFSTTTFSNSPTHSRHTDCVFEGFKALSIRCWDSFPIVSITSTTLHVPWADDHPFPEVGDIFLAVNQLSNTKVAYTGITKIAATGGDHGDPALLRFDGLGSDETGTYGAGDNILAGAGGASSGIVFDRCRFGGMHHGSGFPCHYKNLGSPMPNPGGGIEISGIFLTEITFNDWIIQHNEQMGFHLHYVREVYFSDEGQAEGNHPTGDTEEGLRFIASPWHATTTDEVLDTVAISAAGSGYTAGDILTLVPGTFTKVAKLRVDTVDGSGAVTAVSVFIRGMYSVGLVNVISVTGGTGTLATFDLTYVEQYNSGDTYQLHVGSTDLLLSDGNDFRPKIPLTKVKRWSNAEDTGFFEPNFVEVPQWALRSDTDQGTGIVPPVGGKTGLLKSQGLTSGNRIPTSHDPEYALYYDDTLDFVKVGDGANPPEEIFHVSTNKSGTETQGIRVTAFKPHLTLEDKTTSARDWQLWVDSDELHILYGDIQSNDKLTGTLIQFALDVVKPGLNNTVTLGIVGKRFSDVHAEVFRVGSAAVRWTSGTVVPNTNVTGPIGSLYTHTNGGAGTTLWVKESGTGNTGWVAK